MAQAPTKPTLMLPCHILDTGYCLAYEAMMIQGGRWRHMACHAIVVLLQHPTRGWILWDTGYGPRMFAATEQVPERFYRWATPLRLRPELAVITQLSRLGLRPADIKTIILSHLHADHVAGLCDFPNATIVLTEEAHEHAATVTGLAALRRGYLPALFPSDFAERATLLPSFTGTIIQHLGPSHDLFGDGLLRLVRLPGHARGQLGLLAQTERGTCFFVADAAWLTRNITENCPPARFTDLIVDDPTAVRQTITNLHHVVQAHPDWRLIPSHCPVAFAREVTPVERLP